MKGMLGPEGCPANVTRVFVHPRLHLTNVSGLMDGQQSYEPSMAPHQRILFSEERSLSEDLAAPCWILAGFMLVDGRLAEILVFLIWTLSGSSLEAKPHASFPCRRPSLDA